MLNELLEEYKETDDTQSVINEFTNMLWSSKYTLKKHKKYFTFDVSAELLNHNKELIELFESHNYIEFTFCKSYYKKRMDYIDYIRIHVNNMYGYLVDKSLYLPKSYYQLLLAPKNEYYYVIESIKNGETVNYQEVKNRIDFSLTQAERIKKEAGDKKIDMKWREYKELINKYIERLFKNYKPPEEYEELHGWQMKIHIDGWSENNYVIKYFCKSLSGYMRNYVKDSFRDYQKYCIRCTKKITTTSNRRKYCDSCKIEIVKTQTLRRVKKFRNVTH